MSSSYYLMCLSHDPALVIRDLAVRRDQMCGPAIDVTLDGHQGCDIVIGRFSYPLVEVGCPPQSSGCTGHHSHINWTDSEWLRLLVAATTAPNSVDAKILAPVTRCWPLDRLRKLHSELNL